MIQAPRSLGQAQSQFNAAYKQMRTATAARCREQLQRFAAPPDGQINPAQLSQVQEAVGQAFSTELVQGRNAFAADGVTALSPYAQAINQGIVNVTAGVIKAHHNWMQRNVPTDVLNWLARPTRTVSEQFRANPLAIYDPAHTFVDPNGYTLSTRIWLVNSRARIAIDQLLAQEIANGTSAVNIAAKLEQWLIPGRVAIRTRTPYGRDGSYDARRLARTEITAAHGRAMLAVAASNPYTDSINWVLSPSHPEIDICDTYAAGSPYSLSAVPGYPAHPHCLCHLSTNTRPVSEVTDELRAMIEAGETAPYVNPANEQAFLLALLGPILINLLFSDVVLT